MLMVHLLRAFRVTLAQDYKLELDQFITLHSKKGVLCTLVIKDIV